MIRSSRDYKPYLRALKYCRPYSARIITALICMALSAIFAIIPPWLIKNVVDDVLIKGDSSRLNLIAIAAVVLSLLKVSFGYAYNYLMAWVGQKSVMDIRLALYDKTQNLPMRVIYRKRTGEFLSRVTNDVTALQDIISSVIVDFVVQSVTFFGILAFLFFINWKLTLATFAILPLTVLAIDRASEKLRRVSDEMQEQLAQLSAVAQEVMSAVRIMRAFAAEKMELERFRKHSSNNFRAIMRATQTSGALGGFIEVLLYCALALILWLGGRDVLKGELTAGELVAFLTYLGLLVQPVRTISRVVSVIQRGVASAIRIFEIMDEPDDTPRSGNPIYLRDMKGEVTFDGVYFAYEKDRFVLNGISFRAAPGEKIALAGQTGAGKSTIADLILRFYDPTKGNILIDGAGLRDIDVLSYRRKIGVVPQDPVLMKGSFAYNISYGMENASADDIVKAAETAGIADFISRLPAGYDTEIGERGVTLSGGQRQRIAIARAVVRDPAILIMDEATSSLDSMVESQVQSAMAAAMTGRTSIVIAHRLSTIRDADRILVLEAGRIAEAGNHGELMRARGIYHSLYSIQSGQSGQSGGRASASEE
ncbi:ABC transporter permease [Synergistales bacterium]|nr:ABC transporter permease [Synergistales bacterium]